MNEKDGFSPVTPVITHLRNATAEGLISHTDLDGYLAEDARTVILDLETGERLWEDLTEAPSVSNPAIYEHDGAQYVAFVSGGNSILKPSVGDMVSVYRLPVE